MNAGAVSSDLLLIEELGADAGGGIGQVQWVGISWTEVTVSSGYILKNIGMEEWSLG
jgi:hypothetical protein